MSATWQAIFFAVAILCFVLAFLGWEIGPPTHRKGGLQFVALGLTLATCVFLAGAVAAIN